jgi:hypothetical protein
MDYVAPEVKDLADPDLLHLMGQLMNMNMETRMTVKQAQNHQFFKAV